MDTENEQNLRDDEWQNQPQDPAGLFSPTHDEERLEEDGDSPAAPPPFEDDDHMPLDHPNADTDMDAGGTYFGGRADEAGYKPDPEDHDDDVGPVEFDHE